MSRPVKPRHHASRGAIAIIVHDDRVGKAPYNRRSLGRCGSELHGSAEGEPVIRDLAALFAKREHAGLGDPTLSTEQPILYTSA